MTKTNIRYGLLPIFLCVFLTLGAGSAVAQESGNDTLKSVPVTDGIWMLMGAGGNIAVNVGDDGVLLVDDQFAFSYDVIVKKIREITDQPVKMLLNTHWHSDHSGGNEKFANAGTLILAHDNVRKRMSAEHVSSFFKSTSPPSPEAALPVVTFDSSVTLHINDQTIQARHVAPAHTDGDSVIWFAEKNVVHMGDLFFNGLYPFIDVDSGGSLQGMIAAVNAELENIDDETLIIPGHGPLADRAALIRYRDMLTTVAGRIEMAVDKGRTRQQVVDAEPAREFDAEWGKGFIKAGQWSSLAYDAFKAGQ